MPQARAGHSAGDVSFGQIPIHSQLATAVKLRLLQQCAGWVELAMTSRTQKRLNARFHLFGGECLLCQFSTELLLLLSYELFVATRIYERVRIPVSHEWIFFF